MNCILSPLFLDILLQHYLVKHPIQRVKHGLGPPRFGGGYHPVVFIEKHFLNLHPPMPFLSLILPIVASPDPRDHRLYQLVAAAVTQHFPMGKMLRVHFTKPLQDLLLRKLRAEIQGIPDNAGGSVMCRR